MKERPILFSAPMVRAILDGSKTQTRRIVKPQPYSKPLGVLRAMGWNWDHKISTLRNWMDALGFGTQMLKHCPYGQPGDRLWVRETFCQFPEDARDGNGAQTYYRAEQHDDQMPEVERIMAVNGVRWTPSIHMPRSASRILLEIVSVRVERLCDINQGDALAEGMLSVRTREWDEKYFPEWRRAFDEACEQGSKPPVGPLPSQAFRELWKDINGADSWDANPWVWVVEFTRVAP